MANTWYTGLATEQAPFANYPGGGITSQGSPATAGFNDPALEIGGVKEVTAIYTMTGNEAANDIINIYLAQPGSMVTPTGSVTGSGIAGSATISVGDDDTTGAAITAPTVILGASTTRYSASIDVHANQQIATGSPVSFQGGDALTAPFIIGSTAAENATAGGTIAGSWVQAKFLTLLSVTKGTVLVFRLKVVKP